MNSNDPTDQAMQNACRDLPENYHIVVWLENGYGEAMLNLPDGREVSLDDPELSIAEQIDQHVSDAKELSP